MELRMAWLRVMMTPDVIGWTAVGRLPGWYRTSDAVVEFTWVYSVRAFTLFVFQAEWRLAALREKLWPCATHSWMTLSWDGDGEGDGEVDDGDAPVCICN